MCLCVLCFLSFSFPFSASCILYVVLCCFVYMQQGRSRLRKTIGTPHILHFIVYARTNAYTWNIIQWILLYKTKLWDMVTRISLLIQRHFSVRLFSVWEFVFRQFVCFFSTFCSFYFESLMLACLFAWFFFNSLHFNGKIMLKTFVNLIIFWLWSVHWITFNEQAFYEFAKS